MKKIILFITLFSLCLSQSTYKRNTITIYYIDKEILTPYKLTEQYFDQYYLKKSDSICISDKIVIDSFLSKINKLEYESNDNYFPDVRQKIIIRILNDDDIIIYSDGGTSMQKDGRVINYDSTFQFLIDKTIKDYLMKKEPR